MADLAQIGFAADTSDLAKAKSALDALVPATKAAETSAANAADAIASTGAAAKSAQKPVTDLGKATSTSGKITQAAGQATKAAGIATKDAGKAAVAATGAIDKHATAHKGLSTQAMAAQHSIRSMAEGLISGQPVTQVLTQQLNHLSYAASGPGGLTKAFKDVGGMFSQFITKGVLVGGAVAAAAAVMFMLAKSAFDTVLALDDLSTTTGVTISKLHALEQSMQMKGISGEEMTKGIEKFSESVDEAKNNMGTLNTLMKANGMSASSLQGYLMNVADLVARSKNGAQAMKILQEAGLPANAQWVRYMQQGGAAIKTAMDNSVQFDDEAEKNMIATARKFDDAWNSASTNFKNNFQSAIVSTIGLFDTFSGKMQKAATDFGSSSFWKLFTDAPPKGELQQLDDYLDKLSKAKSGANQGMFPTIPKMANGDNIANNTITGRPESKTTASAAPAGIPAAEKPVGGDIDKKSKVKTGAEATNDISKAQQQIALLGDLATTTEKVKQKQLELAAAGLQGVGVSAQRRAALLNEVRAQSDMTKVQEQATAGIFNSQLAYKAADETLQNWIDKGLVDATNANQMAAAHGVLARQIRATKEAAEVAAAPLQQLKQLELDSSNFSKLMDTSVTGALNNLVSPIQDVMNGVTGIKDGFKSMAVVVLKAIQEMIIKMLILAPIARALQSALGGSGGILSFLGAKDGGTFNKTGSLYAMGGAFGTTKFAKGADFTNQIVNRSTLFSFANGTKLGEMGEAGPEAIMPLKRGSNGSLGVQMHGSASSVNITHAPTYNVAQGADPVAIRELKNAISDDRKNFAKNAVQAVSTARQRNAKV